MISLPRKLFSAAFSTALFAGLAISAFAQAGGSLSGSYRLDRNASEDTQRIIENAAGRDSVSDSNSADLEDKLEAPDTITIGINGTQVTLETSLGGSPAVFNADNVARSSVRSDGSSVSVRAGFRGGSLTVSSLGGDSDFTLNFTPIESGSKLRVTRRVTTRYLSETVFADSIYVRTDGYSGNVSTSGRDDDYSSSSGDDRYSSSSKDKTYSSSSGDDDKGYSSSDDNRPYSSSDDNRPYSSSDPNDFPVRSGSSPQARQVGNGSFAVPVGTVLKGRLENAINTKASQENDPFRLTVDSPNEFGGAILEGYITGIERSGKITGRSTLTLNFKTITFADGRRFDFAGVVSEVVTADGDELSVNNEGEIHGGSRTKTTLKRSGVGAGIGAILGGILGGGKGALIGASIGAGAGAGSMIPGGRGDLELDPGTTLTITSTGPGGR